MQRIVWPAAALQSAGRHDRPPRCRQDPRKLARIRELLLLEKEVKAAKNPLKNLEGVPDDLEVGGEGEEGEEGGMDE